jgi:hypothetical protein
MCGNHDGTYLTFRYGFTVRKRGLRARIASAFADLDSHLHEARICHHRLAPDVDWACDRSLRTSLSEHGPGRGLAKESSKGACDRICALVLVIIKLL